MSSILVCVFLFSPEMKASPLISGKLEFDRSRSSKTQCRDLVENSRAGEESYLREHAALAEASHNREAVYEVDREQTLLGAQALDYQSFETKWQRIQDYFSRLGKSSRRSEAESRRGVLSDLDSQRHPGQGQANRSSSWQELRERLTLDSSERSREIKVKNSDFVFDGGVLLRRGEGRGATLVVRFKSIKLMDRLRNSQTSPETRIESISETGTEAGVASEEPKPLAYLGRAKGLDRRFFRLMQTMLLAVRENLLLHPEIDTLQISGEEVVNPFLRELLAQMGFKEFSDEDYERETGMIPVHSYLRSYILQIQL